jgi:hypothetical protein
VQNEPSRFMDELPENFIDRSFAAAVVQKTRVMAMELHLKE